MKYFIRIVQPFLFYLVAGLVALTNAEAVTITLDRNHPLYQLTIDLIEPNVDLEQVILSFSGYCESMTNHTIVKIEKSRAIYRVPTAGIGFGKDAFDNLKSILEAGIVGYRKRIAGKGEAIDIRFEIMPNEYINEETYALVKSRLTDNFQTKFDKIKEEICCSRNHQSIVQSYRDYLKEIKYADKENLDG